VAIKIPVISAFIAIEVTLGVGREWGGPQFFIIHNLLFAGYGVKRGIGLLQVDLLYVIPFAPLKR
jgi:hypothetical protein